jgi:hypothetical protein
MLIEDVQQRGRPAAEPVARELSPEFFQRVEARRTATPVPRPVPMPIPLPLLIGSRFMIWKQDPTVHALGRRLTFIPRLVLNGPRDSRITTELAGTTPVNRGTNGDFIFAEGTPEADCAHGYAVVRQTLTLSERARNGTAVPWAWNQGGNTDPLAVFPRGFAGANAFYSRNQKSLKFGFFTPTGAATPVFTGRSLDIVAHETGHAILDGLKPGWLGFGNPPQTGGLHESFGDLIAIFLALSQLDQVEAFIAMTKANLHDKNFLAELAEEFGSALGRPAGLRNADNNLKLSEVSNEVHAISQVFTGGVYDVLADIFAFEKNQQRDTKDPAQVLLEVGQKLFRLVLEALIQAPNVGATYADVVNRMLTISFAQGDPVIYRTFIRNRFTFREVVVSPVPLTAMATGRMDLADPGFVEGADSTQLEIALPEHASITAPQDRSGCCGTMQLPEYALDQKTLDDNLRRLQQPGQMIAEDELMAAEVASLQQSFR